MKRKPTKLQQKTVRILKENPNMPLGQAMRKAGYAETTSWSPNQNFLELKGTAIAIEKWREELRGSGLNEAWLLRKYKEWGEATKIKSSITEPDKVVPDYETQLKIHPYIRRDLGLPDIKEEQNLNVQSEKTIIFNIVKDDGKNRKDNQTSP